MENSGILDPFEAQYTLDFHSDICHSLGMDVSQIQEMDRNLAVLAKYAATRGGTKTSSKAELISIFKEMKSLIMRRQATQQELQEHIYRLYGDPDYSTDIPEVRDPTPEDLLHMPECEKSI